MGDKLTKTVVDRAKGTPGRQSIVWCGELKGFGLRIAPGGVKAYIVNYHNKAGQQKRIVIGRHGLITVDEARVKARQMLLGIGEGQDPAQERVEAKQELTLNDLWTIYEKQHVNHLKARTASTDRLRYDKHLRPAFGSMLLSDINARLIERFKAELATDRKIVFNRCLALLSSMLNAARRWGYLEGPNPCELVRRFPENKRRRYMSPDEVLRFARTLDALEVEAKEFVKKPGGNNRVHIPCLWTLRFLLYTGMRRGEVHGLTWDMVDVGRGVIELPDSKTGAKTICLNRLALELLTKTPRTSKYVFPGRIEGEPIKELNWVWRRILKDAELSDLKMHDLRHAFASVAASQGLGLPVIGELLGHKQTATTARYSHLMTDPMRAAAEVVGAELERMMTGTAQIVEVGKTDPDEQDAKTKKAGG